MYPNINNEDELSLNEAVFLSAVESREEDFEDDDDTHLFV